MRTDHVHLARRTALRRWLAAAALAVLSLNARAFVSPSPPPGFGGSPGGWTFTPPTPAEQLGGIMRGPGPSIAGRGTTAAYRLGGGAARALAGRAVAGLIPGLGLALGVAWLAQNCFEQQGGQWVRTCFADSMPVSDGWEYRQIGGSGAWHATLQAACDASLPWFKSSYPSMRNWGSPLADMRSNAPYCTVTAENPANGNQVETFSSQVSRRTSGCPAGWYITPAGCIQTPQPQPVTKEQIEEEMAPKPLPPTLPNGVPYPIELPSIWNPTPGANPTSQPLRVPEGNPRPVPNTEPQQWRQPTTVWTHQPTTEDPWRMDVKPEDVVSTNPQGITEPQPVAEDNPNDQTEKPEDFDLCKEHPDILACAKPELDTPDGEIPKTSKNITFAPESVLGGGSCPADVQLDADHSFSYTRTCDALTTYVRPLAIAVAGWMAIVIIFGIGRPET